MTPENPFKKEEISKIHTFSQTTIIVAKEKERGKTSGLITGCFDVLHKGHIDLFRAARQRVDVVVVGVERDETLESKAPGRPINILKWRCEILAELASVDLVFPIEFTIEYDISPENDILYKHMYQTLNPDYLITNPIADIFWKQKLQTAEELGIGFLGLLQERPTSSTNIINKLWRED